MKPELTTREKALAIAAELHRRVNPLDWRKRVDAIEDDEIRAIVDEYLRGILHRMKVAKAAKAANEAAKRGGR